MAKISNMELLDGTLIQTFPKEQKGEPASQRADKAEVQAVQRLFYDNAFLFLVNRKRILSDSRMFLAPIPTHGGLACTGTGEPHNPTLGVYLEFWLNCHSATRMDENGRKSLVCRISGSHFSGADKCVAVYEDGEVESIHIPYCRPVWRMFMDINKRYDDAKATCESYSLRQVVDVLHREGLADYDQNAVDVFFFKSAAEYWKDRCLSTEATCDRLRRDVHLAKMDAKRTQMTELVDEINRRQMKIDALSREIRELRKAMLKKLHSKEMTPAEYQRWWLSLPLRKEKDEAVADQKGLAHSTMKSLFPEDYMVMSMEEAREFVAKQD